MKFRTIYMLELFDDNFNVVVRLFFRNKRAAERALNLFDEDLYSVTLVPKRDHIFINPDDVLS